MRSPSELRIMADHVNSGAMTVDEAAPQIAKVIQGNPGDYTPPTADKIYGEMANGTEDLTLRPNSFDELDLAGYSFTDPGLFAQLRQSVLEALTSAEPASAS